MFEAVTRRDTIRVSVAELLRKRRNSLHARRVYGLVALATSRHREGFGYVREYGSLKRATGR